MEEQYERQRQITRHPPHSQPRTSSDDSFAPLPGSPFMLLGEPLVLVAVVVVHGVQSLRMAWRACFYACSCSGASPRRRSLPLARPPRASSRKTISLPVVKV